MAPGQLDGFETTSGTMDHYACLSGNFMHGVCIFGVNDLPFLTSPLRIEMFANKFYWDYQPLALDCLEYWLWNRTVWEYTTYGTPAFPDLTNLTYFENLPYVKNHVPCKID